MNETMNSKMNGMSKGEANVSSLFISGNQAIRKNEKNFDGCKIPLDFCGRFWYALLIED